MIKLVNQKWTCSVKRTFARQERSTTVHPNCRQIEARPITLKGRGILSSVGWREGVYQTSFVQSSRRSAPSALSYHQGLGSIVVAVVIKIIVNVIITVAIILKSNSPTSLILVLELWIPPVEIDVEDYEAAGSKAGQ